MKNKELILEALKDLKTIPMFKDGVLANKKDERWYITPFTKEQLFLSIDNIIKLVKE